jgi:uncharacterized damage-inducible protein DinB
MEPLFEADFDLLQVNHKEILHALADLPAAALDWSPGIDMNPISVLVFHLTGSERFWIGDVVMREPSGRDRDAEFAVHGLGADLLKKRLDDSLDYARLALERLTLAALPQERTGPPEGRTVTVAWALLHALEHGALHVGHIQLVRQLWDQSNRK